MQYLKHRSALRPLAVALACLGYLVLAGCTSADDELNRFIEETRRKIPPRQRTVHRHGQRVERRRAPK